MDSPGEVLNIVNPMQSLHTGGLNSSRQVQRTGYSKGRPSTDSRTTIDAIHSNFDVMNHIVKESERN